MPWTKPNNDFTVVYIKEPTWDYAVFRVYKHYVVDEADQHRMVQYIIGRDEASEGLEYIRDTTDTDKLTWRVFSRDRILLMDWSTDTDGSNLVDGNAVCNELSEGSFDINSAPSRTVFENIDGAFSQFLAWIQYVP